MSLDIENKVNNFLKCENLEKTAKFLSTKIEEVGKDKQLNEIKKVGDKVKQVRLGCDYSKLSLS